MDKDEKKAFRLGVLSGVAGNALWGALLAGGAMVGGAAVWLHGLTDFEQAILYTLSAVLLVLAGAIATRLYWKTRIEAKRSLLINDAPIATSFVTAPEVNGAQDAKDAAPAETPGPESPSRERERMRVVLRSLSAEALQELNLLRDGPRSVSMVDKGMSDLQYCGLVESLGPGRKFGEFVFNIDPAARDTVAEYYAEFTAKAQASAAARKSNDWRQHPGALSQLDLNLYRSLTVVQAMLEQAKGEFQDEPRAKPMLNKILAGYNAAQDVYKIYHRRLESGGAPDAATVQATIDALKNDLADLQRAFRKGDGQ